MSNQSPQDHQKVGWFELFYDLVIVATVGYAAHTFAEEPTWAFGAWISAWVLVMLVLWSLTTLSYNLFPGDFAWRRIIGLAQMLALVVGALGMVADEGLSTASGFGGMAVAFGCGTALYVVAYLKRVGDRRVALQVALPAAAGTLVLASGMRLPDDTGWSLTDVAPITLAVGVGLVGAGLFVVVGRLPRLGDQAHLSERFGQLIIIVLGETFLSLVAALGGESQIPNPLFLVLTFLMVFSIWSVYFSSVVPAGPPRRPVLIRTWYVLHWPLTFGAVGAAAGFSIVMLVPFGEEDASVSATWTTAPLAIVMLSLAVLTWIGAGRVTAQVRVHLTVAAILGVLVVVDELWTNTAANWEITAGVIAVVADAYVSRRLDSPEDRALAFAAGDDEPSLG